MKTQDVKITVKEAKEIANTLREADDLNFKSSAPDSELDHTSPFPHFLYRVKQDGRNKVLYEKAVEAHKKAVALGFINDEDGALVVEAPEGLEKEFKAFDSQFDD